MHGTWYSAAYLATIYFPTFFRTRFTGKISAQNILCSLISSISVLWMKCLKKRAYHSFVHHCCLHSHHGHYTRHSQQHSIRCHTRSNLKHKFNVINTQTLTYGSSFRHCCLHSRRYNHIFFFYSGSVHCHRKIQRKHRLNELENNINLYTMKRSLVYSVV